MASETIALTTLIIGSVSALLGGAWKLRHARQEAELGWAERAEGLWQQMEKLQREVDGLRGRSDALLRRVDTLERLVDALRSESTALRMAIRSADDLQALKAQEKRIPETVG